MYPKLTLVGAGPGDPDLITLKAVKALASADVVLYDALANHELLEHCSEKAELIYVGKRGHKRGISQDQINELIVEKAIEKGHVVRLKGGDPFVFGRGGEEINFATERGIDAGYIPGISSVNSIGISGIPLTDRNSADGFWVITGHKKDRSLSRDVQLAAQSNATLVILMGMSKLEEISNILVNEGKGNIPAAIIQNVSSSKEKKGVGKASELLQMAEANDLSNPAVIIIGDVVHALKNGFGKTENKKLLAYERRA
ncbi:uroporphyrinogen-III C-methyltransferase [Jiulongibacter sediminis]|uniref:uroporphyrinogen-III C-methyltransferase n=1 Tax=Jiulongibacter sediminis TaxID=1605367 RepID=UPI0026EC76CC|nr:uroporphyrinogen-III C-methyltransferase [Jiulongibacter sediminis]